MADKWMYISNDGIHNYHFCSLQLVVETLTTQLDLPTNKNCIKVHKVVNPTNENVIQKL